MELKNFLSKNRVAPPLADFMMADEPKGLGMEAITDFASAFTHANYADAIGTHIGDKVPECKENVVAVGRVRTAWLRAQRELAKATEAVVAGTMPGTTPEMQDYQVPPEVTLVPDTTRDMPEDQSRVLPESALVRGSTGEVFSHDEVAAVYRGVDSNKRPKLVNGCLVALRAGDESPFEAKPSRETGEEVAAKLHDSDLVASGYLKRKERRCMSCGDVCELCSQMVLADFDPNDEATWCNQVLGWCMNCFQTWTWKKHGYWIGEKYFINLSKKSWEKNKRVLC